MQFIHDEEKIGRVQVVCTDDAMKRSRQQIEEHIGHYINSLDKAHINVTICGGGNATHVLAAYVGEHPNTHTAILKCNKEYEHFKNALATFDNVMIAKHRDGRPDAHGKVDIVTDKPEEVIPSSDVIIISIPAYVHEFYFSAIAPHLTAGTIVGVMVAEGGTDLCARSCLGAKEDDIVFFGMETLPWACRYEEYAHLVNIRETKQIVNVAVDPPSKRFDVCAVLQYLIGHYEKDTGKSIPEYHPVANLLSMSLMNMNAYVHPSIIYGKFKDWDGVSSFPEKPLFYEGVDEFTASVLVRMNDELQSLKAAIVAAYPEVDLSNVIGFKEWMAHAYGDPIPEGADLQIAMNCVCKLSGRYAGIFHVMTETADGGFVPDVTYRYWTEDIPCGLVVMKGFAELFGVEVPMVTTVILWMQSKMGKEYITETGVNGRDLKETKAPQRFGLPIDAVMKRYF